MALTLPPCLWLPVRFSWWEAEQETAGWQDGEARVFIPLLHPQPKQALWGYESAVAPFLHPRLQLRLSPPLSSYRSLQLLKNSSSSVLSGFRQDGKASLCCPPGVLLLPCVASFYWTPPWCCCLLICSSCTSCEHAVFCQDFDRDTFISDQHSKVY